MTAVSIRSNPHSVRRAKLNRVLIGILVESFRRSGEAPNVKIVTMQQPARATEKKRTRPR